MCAFHVFEHLFVFVLEEALERDNFMSPDEAKEFGVVDHVLNKPSDQIDQDDSGNESS